MVESALIWIGVTAVCGLLCLAGTLKGYAETKQFNYWGIAGTSVAASGVVELLVANNYVPDTLLSNILRLSLLLIGGAFIVVAYRTHGTDWLRSNSA